jgi:hypothetical protein
LQPWHKKAQSQSQSQSQSPSSLTSHARSFSHSIPRDHQILPPPPPPPPQQRPRQPPPRPKRPSQETLRRTVPQTTAPAVQSSPATQWQCSDLVVRCKEDVYHVDRTIMCYHSKWFARICAIMRSSVGHA